jgi:hypothetical protein
MPVSWALAVGTNGVTGLQLDVLDGVEVQGTVVDQTGRPTSASVQLRPKPADAVFTTIGPPLNTAYAGVTLGAARFVLPAEPGWGPQIPSLERIRDRIVEVARSQVRSATAAPDGRFEFHRVYPGNYVLEVNSGGITVPVQEIQVGLGALTNVSLNTSLSLQVPGIQVTGRVVGPSGAPLPKLNYIRLVRSADSNVFYGFPDAEGRFSLVLVPGAYRVFAERLGRPVQSVSDGSRDITNAEFTVEGGRNLQIVVTLEP